jgi:hypothetical protein
MTYEIKIAARLGIAKSLQNLLDQNINGIRGIKYNAMACASAAAIMSSAV